MKLLRHLVLVAASFLAVPLAADDVKRVRWQSTSATAQLEINRAVAWQFGFTLEARAARHVASHHDYARYRFALSGLLEFDIADGHYAYPASGELSPSASIAFIDGARRASPTLVLHAREPGRGGLVFADPSGAAWLVVTDVHQHFDADAGRLSMTHLDVRIGPALARWKRHTALEGRAIGALHLHFDGASNAVLAREKATAACNSPNWPGTPGTVTDVALTEIDDVDVYCDGALSGGAGNCSNTGSNPSANLKFLPSVRLKNIGSADVPWYQKFDADMPPAPYPYGTLDQHPYLVWNIYRLNADGRFEQIARSGVKHAFRTGNERCSCPNDNILAPLCEDPYDAFSNDITTQLGPRREVLAREGIFAKCFSTSDHDCDGNQSIVDPTPNPALRYRATVHESDLMAANWPGARYFLDAWYVVRDDGSLYNSMGSREFTPTWVTTSSASFWQMVLADDALPMPKGAVIDRWVDPASTALHARNTEVITARGRLKLAVRVVNLGNGRWRYDYAVMNFDYADPITSGSESDIGGLRVLRNQGISAVRIPLLPFTTTSAHETFDGTGSAADDWSVHSAANELAFEAPGSNTLDWGAMFRYSFVANAPPIEGVVVLEPFEPGSSPLAVSTVHPGISGVQFADGFEAP